MGADVGCYGRAVGVRGAAPGLAPAVCSARRRRASPQPPDHHPHPHRLYRALDRRTAITITYLDTDGTETIRTIEPWDIRTTKAGRIQLRAGCRLRGGARSFYVDPAYTLHRIGYVLDQPEATTPAGTTIMVRSVGQLIARELGRDYLPARRRLPRPTPTSPPRRPE
ncbi:WYL domain-containing protein [Streptomyces lavendulocolor]|uniref:WYL domain-containing protein n=1 Tax=Streptomyces lavendulocolor TaxID=67316 RepID=UPI003C2D66AA